MINDDQSGQSLNTKTASSPRRWNPLSKLSSYTYNITLYMLSPEATNYVSINGTLPPKNPAFPYYIIAQSGGLTDGEPRGFTSTSLDSNPQQGLDFYIDNLEIQTYFLGADGSRTASTDAKITFKIIEPSGFTFLTKLAKLAKKLNSESQMVSQAPEKAHPNLYQYQYLIGIRFYGYKADGTLMTISDMRKIGQEVNDSFDDNRYSLFERFYPINISSCATAYRGRGAEYDFISTFYNYQAAFGVKHGIIPSNVEIIGSSVGDILGSKQSPNSNSLINRLNETQNQEKLKNNTQNPVTYDIEWIDTNEIKNSPLMSDSEYDAAITPMNIAGVSVDKINAKLSTKSSTIDKNSIIAGFAPSTPVLLAIDQIITKSKYVSETLLATINQQINATSKSNVTKDKLSWYIVHPHVIVKDRDSKTQDWSYDITYQIKQYHIPYLVSQYNWSRTGYYGAVKEYNYLFTGENTEIISFEIVYDNLFYTTKVSVATNNDITTKVNNSSGVPVHPVGGSVSAPGNGKLNSSDLISENVRGSVYSPLNQAQATIRIIGDPDYLMDTLSKKVDSDSINMFFSKNLSINPYSGQIFIEIIFDMAEDYKSNGLYDVDKSQTVLFYPPEIQKKLGTKGIVYNLRQIDSSFRGGKFEQTLSLVYVQPDSLIPPESTTTETPRERVNENVERLYSGAKELQNAPRADKEKASLEERINNSIQNIHGGAIALDDAAKKEKPGGWISNYSNIYYDSGRPSIYEGTGITSAIKDIKNWWNSKK